MLYSGTEKEHFSSLNIAVDLQAAARLRLHDGLLPGTVES